MRMNMRYVRMVLQRLTGVRYCYSDAIIIAILLFARR
jgi:hypothetical protein